MRSSARHPGVVLKDTDGTGEGRCRAGIAVEEGTGDAGLQDLEQPEVGYRQEGELGNPPQLAHTLLVSRSLCRRGRGRSPGCARTRTGSPRIQRRSRVNASSRIRRMIRRLWLFMIHHVLPHYGGLQIDYVCSSDIRSRDHPESCPFPAGTAPEPSTPRFARSPCPDASVKTVVGT